MPPRTSNSTRRGLARAKTDRQKEIVAAAAECFEQYGVQRTRVEDVARSAGISGTNFYNFFPSRSALIDAVVLARVDAIINDALPAIERTDGLRDAVITGLARTIETSRRDALFMELLRLTRQKRLGELAGEPAGFGFDMLVRLWRPTLERARAAGQLRPELDEDETIAWLGRVSLMLLISGTESTSEIRRMVSLYVAPALTVGIPPETQ